MKNTIRIATTLAALAAAVASQAVIFSYSGQTTSGASAPGQFQTSPPTGAAASQSPFNTLTNGTVTLTGIATGNSVIFTNASGTSTLTLSFTNGTPDDTTIQGLSSISTTAYISAATGIFTPYVSPSFAAAAVAGNQLTVTSNTYTAAGINFFTAIGNVNPVPEPTSVAALAIGGLGLVARRRKA